MPVNCTWYPLLCSTNGAHSIIFSCNSSLWPFTVSRPPLFARQMAKNTLSLCVPSDNGFCGPPPSAATRPRPSLPFAGPKLELSKERSSQAMAVSDVLPEIFTFSLSQVPEMPLPEISHGSHLE